MPLGIGFEPAAGSVDGDVLADAGHEILERAPLGRVIEHVIDGDQRDAVAGRVAVEQGGQTRGAGQLAGLGVVDRVVELVPVQDGGEIQDLYLSDPDVEPTPGAVFQCSGQILDLGDVHGIKYIVQFYNEYASFRFTCCYLN